jgi:hypothetical protein
LAFVYAPSWRLNADIRQTNLMPSHVYLVKESNALVSHCTCAAAQIAFPPQQSCPWCGCGWLFTCIDCLKAFTFARAVELDESWRSLAYRDLRNHTNEPELSEVEAWIDAMRELHADVVVGQTYVYLDGVFIPVDFSSVHFDGWHARHAFDFVPQVAALTDPSVIERFLANPDYWNANAPPAATLH